MLNRRTFLSTASASVALPLIPLRPSWDQRKFLFVIARGGWDTTKVFTPMFGHRGVDMDAEATRSTVSGITFTDAAVRPSVRTFFEAYGHRTCIVNGIHTPERTHARNRRLVLSGCAEGSRSDWGATLGDRARQLWHTPHLVPRSTDAAAVNTDDDAAVALDALELGTARAATIRSGDSWDTHANNDLQDGLFEGLFASLHEIMAGLDTRRGTLGRPLAEEVTVVVLSELGRAPILNPAGGRDHSCFTSAMLIGAGVRGGQVVGAMDATFQGAPVHLTSGEASRSGEQLTPRHLGATLLALGDVDPGTEGLSEHPISAALA